jgi:hypothetical protein
MGGAGIPERMANSYYRSGVATLDYWRNHEYGAADVEPYNADMFIVFYEMIANINTLIEGMAKYEDRLDPATYAIVRGEALGIRALVHFDLLRIYGPVPYAPDPAVEYLPYIRANSSGNYPYHTFDAYKRMVLEDLDEAQRLLEPHDPIITEPLATTEVDYYRWDHRKSRMNYYGVLALQARARHYFGDAGALDYARLVVAATEPDGTPKFRLTTAADMETGTYSDDRLCYSEHITGTKILNYDIYALASTDPWVPSRRTFSQERSDFGTLMTGGNLATTDIRYAKLIDDVYISSPRPGRYVWSSEKYMGFRNPSNSPRNFPIIRLSEMYFIIMELGTLSEANELYREYCESRLAPFTDLTAADREDRLLWEFIREFYAEGQNFFRYKRTGVENMWFADTPCTEEQYRLPLPQRETSVTE